MKYIQYMMFLSVLTGVFSGSLTAMSAEETAAQRKLDELSRQAYGQDSLRYLSEKVRREEHIRRMEDFESRLSRTNDPEARRLIMQSRADYENTQYQKELRSTEGSARVWEHEARVQVIRAETLAVQATQRLRIEQIRAEGQERAKGMVGAAKAQAEAYIQFIRQNPKLIAGLSAAIFTSYYVAKNGVTLATDQLKSYLKIPTLAQETSLVSWSAWGKGLLVGRQKVEHSLDDLVYEPALQTKITSLTHSLRNIYAHGCHFPHMVLYGPPGTGKTLAAMTIARNSGLEYIYMSGSSLRKYAEISEALKKIDELFSFVRHHNKPIVLIFDECEKLFGNRDAIQNDFDRQIINHIYMHTGSETRDFMIIGLTNKVADLDQAFKSRCSELIEVGLPQLAQRELLLKNYIKKWIIDDQRSRYTTSVKSVVQSFFGFKPSAKTQIKLASEVLDGSMIRSIAQRIEQFTGRDISQMINSFKIAAYATADRTLTVDMVNRIVVDKMNKKQIELQQKTV